MSEQRRMFGNDNLSAWQTTGNRFEKLVFSKQALVVEEINL